ncbi:hypothetical protein BU14_0399s0007 [Porphyra umbilicalis]|uniref:AAA+ ATPase domain-containing protein n=1 Tax=Porphyra umbilicalis TaxID=2786 RepID=A0A1X6NWB0_PORUM|nr:hypothetical protein BU14_0399s0007 [Porphyra umbilicalis]|eukprot:OSX72862.1 hypothetical protein BU14_0399s0007 [Porphyra umbilicalis]
MAVLKWKRANENKQRKVDWFHLFRFELHGDSHGRWRLSGRHLTRPVDTIVLDPTIRDALLDDARAFDTKAALRWYTLHGLPYRRCYLFYGPPGTGKSSFIRALAGVLKRSVAFFQCAHNKLNDQILADAFRDCPSQSILVLEDIDCLFTSAAGGVGARESRSEVHISLAGLLNALDGLLSGTRGRITVLSSNHPQLLDAALIRSGRVDHTVEFALPTRADMATLFTGFYPEATAASAKAFADKVFSVSMNTEDRTVATMQQLFIKYRGRSIKEVLDGVEGFVEARRSGPMGVNGHSPGVYL